MCPVTPLEQREEQTLVKGGPSRDPRIRFEAPHNQPAFPPSSFLTWAGQTLGNPRESSELSITLSEQEAVSSSTEGDSFMASDGKRGTDLWRRGINRITSLTTSVYRQGIYKEEFFRNLCIIRGFVTSSPILSR